MVYWKQFTKSGLAFEAMRQPKIANQTRCKLLCLGVKRQLCLFSTFQKLLILEHYHQWAWNK